MSERFQIVAGTILVALYGLSALSQRYPHVAWLQHFRILLPRFSEKQQARMGRRASLLAGAQLILLGVIFPLGYLVLTVMTFNTPRTGTFALVLAGSVLCIVLGVTAIVQSGRR